MTDPEFPFLFNHRRPPSSSAMADDKAGDDDGGSGRSTTAASPLTLEDLTHVLPEGAYVVWW